MHLRHRYIQKESQNQDRPLIWPMSSLHILHSPGPTVPFEVLHEIFEELVQPFDPSDGASAYADWLYIRPVTAVCQRWRAAAISSPRLWTMVEPQHVPPDILQLFLSRSRDLPINVQLNEWRLPRKMLKEINDVAGRIEQLGLCLDLERFSQVLQKLGETLTRPAPILCNMCIIPNIEESPAREAHTLPALFSGTHPALQYLRLEWVTLFPSGIFTGLTELHISNTQHEGWIDTFDPLLALLRANSGLERIDLNNAFKCNTYVAVASRSQDLIHLSRLQVLSIVQSDANAVRTLLAHLVLTPTTRIAYTIDYYPSSINAREPPFASLLPLNFTANMPSFRTLQTMHLLWGGHVQGWTADDGRFLFELGICRFTTLDSRTRWGEDVLQYDTLSALSPIPTRELKTLIVDSRFVPDGRNVWAPVFDDMPELETLAVEAVVRPEIFEALMVRREEDDDGNVTTVRRCPLLQSIMLHCTDVTEPARNALRALILERQDTDCPIATIAVFPDSFGNLSQIQAAIGKQRMNTAVSVLENLGVTVDCSGPVDRKRWWVKEVNEDSCDFWLEDIIV